MVYIIGAGGFGREVLNIYIDLGRGLFCSFILWEEPMESDKSVLKLLGIDIGSKTSHTKTITDADIMCFAELSGDFNPLHISDELAKKSPLGGRIAHGIVTAGLISAALAKFPGLVVYLSQTLKFLKPVRIGDTITAEVQVTEVNDITTKVQMKTMCTNQTGTIVLDGEAVVKIYPLPDAIT